MATESRWEYRCPGSAAMNPDAPCHRRATVFHGQGCCERFAALDEAEQEQRGIQVPRR